MNMRYRRDTVIYMRYLPLVDIMNCLNGKKREPSLQALRF